MQTIVVAVCCCVSKGGHNKPNIHQFVPAFGLNNFVHDAATNVPVAACFKEAKQFTSGEKVPT